MPDGITRKTFEGYTTNAKLDTLFDQQQDIMNSINDIRKDFSSQRDVCTYRIADLESFRDKMTGQVIGVVAVITAVINIGAIALRYLL